MGIKICNNSPFFIKRTLDNSKEFKSLIRNFLCYNPFDTLDKYFNHKILVIMHKYLSYCFVIVYMVII
jgi:hypothetical protein